MLAPQATTRSACATDSMSVAGHPAGYVSPRPGARSRADRAVHLRFPGVEQPAVHGRALQLAHRAQVPVGEDGQRAVVVDGAPQAVTDHAQRFVHSASRNWWRPWAGPDQRLQQPVRVVGPLLVALHLHAEVAGRDRVVLHRADAVATPSVTVTVHAQVSGQSCGQAPGTWMVVIGCSSRF